MDKHKAKQSISKLVEKYQRIAKDGKIKSYNEAQTRNEFIEPLFSFLGWDMRNANNDNEVTTEETISNGRVDLAFRINGIPKFFLEAKSLKTDLDIESYARQAINYSWNKGVNWAVLTDFEGIKIFNANAKSKYLRDKLVFEIPYDEYISDFERLWLFSKESFEKSALDVYAEKHGKKSKKLTVNEKLFGDLKQAREILTKSFDNWKGHWDKNKDIDQETLDEGVQRILDRLVFIRVLEDRELEPPILQPIIREWEKDRSGNKQLFQMLIQKFRELNDIYNSNLFIKHACEDWEEYDDATKNAIELLYGNDVYEYNFREIPMEILGGVYESYLGYIAQKPIEIDAGKKSGKLFKIEGKKDLKIKSRKKRKEQGIYYTPNFIVDYIVKNTLGKKLEEVKNMHELKQIKVLDPACGSGSFLIKALEVINDKYKDFNNPGKQDTKSEILLSNIYGVDLDSQAVELAKLNLLINALDQKAKLPNLTDNIRIGNSLISGSEKELKKYFGKNWQDKKPFNWEDEFSFCHSRGGGNPESGFDVIIGNPPWVFTRGEHFSDLEKKYFDKFLLQRNIIQSIKGKNIQSGKLNLYSLFILRSIDLMKSGAIFGFIIPNNILRTTTYDIVRKYILDNCRILSVVDLSTGVFKGVTASSVILIFEKESDKKARDENEITIISEITNLAGKKYKEHRMKQKYYYDNPSFTFNILSDLKSTKLSKKVEENSVKLGFLCKYIIEGIVGSRERDVADTKLNNFYKPFVVGKNIGKYKIDYKGKWICYDRKKLHRARPEEVFLSNKILIQRISGGNMPLVATLDKERYYTFASINNVILKDSVKYDARYILALINSTLINRYYSTNFSNKSELTVNISKTFLEQLPIKILSFGKQQPFIKLVNKILNLNKQLQSIPENSDKWNAAKKEIEKTGGEIDERVYKLYNLTKEEIRIIKRG